MPDLTPEGEDRSSGRARGNLIGGALLLILLVGGLWLGNAMIEARKADECMSSRSLKCRQIDPDKGR